MRHVGAHPFLARLASDGAHGRLPVIGLGLAGSASSLMRPGPGIRPEETDPSTRSGTGVPIMRIEAVVGDITTEKVDAIVNAANSTLLGGGGVDGAIHRAAGPRLLEACQRLRAAELPDGLPVGRAVATPGFDLPASWVIHTVGPNRHAGQDDPALLKACFDNSMALAIDLGCTSIALPAVSAGVYGWPIAEVAEIAVARARAVEDRSRTEPEAAGRLELIRFVLSSQTNHEVFARELDRTEA